MLGVCLAAVAARAQDGPREIKHAFVIAMENHNWTQPNGNVGATSGIQQIYRNPNAPFINSLVSGTGINDLSDLFTPGVVPTHVGGDHDHH